MSTETAATIARRARAAYSAAYESGRMHKREYKLNTALSRLACGTMNRSTVDAETRAALDNMAAIGHILTLRNSTFALTPQGRVAVLDMLSAAAESYPPNPELDD